MKKYIHIYRYSYRYINRYRYRYRYIYIQVGRQVDRQIDRQGDREIDRHIQIYKHIDRYIYLDLDIDIARYTDIQIQIQIQNIITVMPLGSLSCGHTPFTHGTCPQLRSEQFFKGATRNTRRCSFEKVIQCLRWVTWNGRWGISAKPWASLEKLEKSKYVCLIASVHIYIDTCVFASIYLYIYI